MNTLTLLPVVAAVGLRHGVDPDHLAAIDSLSRFHPSKWNGLFFALGHGAFVTLLAIGFGRSIAVGLEPYTAYILVGLGIANIWRLIRPSKHKCHCHSLPQFMRSSPFMLGVLFGMGFETASQLSVFLLGSKMNPWLMGAVFSGGMMLVDGIDGFLAARTFGMARTGNRRAQRSSQILGALVAFLSFVLAAAEWMKWQIDFAVMPIGILLFVVLIGLRLWSSTPDKALSSLGNKP